MSKHSPTPWRLEIDKSTAAWAYYILDAKGQHVATVNAHIAQKMANAKLIIDSVNHDK